MSSPRARPRRRPTSPTTPTSTARFTRSSTRRRRPPLPLAEVVGLQRTGVVVLDARDPNEYAVGHLLGSINIGLGGRYAEYAGGVIQPGAGIVLVTDPGQETEAKIRLARIGYDNVIGHLEAPLMTMESSPADVGHCARLDTAALVALIASGDDIQLVDVRQPGETLPGCHRGGDRDPADQAERTPRDARTRRSRPWSTARAATGRRSPRAECGRRGSPTCPTCSVGMARGRPPRT